MTTGSFGAAALAVGILVAPCTATAAEIKVISSFGMKAVLDEVVPAFEQSTGHTLKFAYGAAATLKTQIDGGETFDLVILTPPIVEDLVKEGKIAADAQGAVARTGAGIAIRAGAPKPDISTPEALKRTLIAAKSITYTQEGLSGLTALRVIEKLGLTEEMKLKYVRQTRPGPSILAVADGNAELGFSLISEILPIREVELVGPVPPELQSYVVYAAGVGTKAEHAAAARSFFDMLKSPATINVLKARGMEPG